MDHPPPLGPIAGDAQPPHEVVGSRAARMGLLVRGADRCAPTLVSSIAIPDPKREGAPPSVKEIHHRLLSGWSPV